ncbi:leucine-rich repeat-containing protein 31 isoform X1 [Coturnix japonica]|uniref:leucine-rich repeat-containing protein 31 isoform X1 n=1 Tax=Coturnix japonica TaxID=93934 RepID=UPI0007779AEB|nr:leucine-rich repeat-containing protein 31 isoform X1 [Coturnix japonica]XP_032302509.1 leucine-rich repeat-containing protein 31 isoform X1 [Coturnix japonica]XP_032302510.1 leucine-rich repeat-containing protein 31 isoform X1 [Coturnix japonica]XP_032302511.1 leucine-rich repeat-containing protein 31 isoform X1 [Coturnix japonica]XP_032302512.1 leucine-rich repeat-containing protein 31 isoform X1 [Coturnix japonica]
MEKSGDAQSCQSKSEEDIPKSSPFDFVIKQFQGKKSPGKRKEQPSAIQKFFSGFGKSEGKERQETEETEINNCKADDQSEKEDLTVEDESSQLISEAESPSGEQRFNQFMQKLGKEPNSKNLDLNNCALSAADVAELASLLPFLPELEEISLSWNGCVGGTLRTLTTQLHHVNLLKVLRLNNCRLSAEDVTSLGEAFEIVPQLEELDLSWNSNIGGKLSLLTKKLRKGCKIKLLKMTDCNLTAKDGESLAETLTVLPNLEVLDLSINKHIGCSMKVIAQDLKNVPGLKELNLHMCGLKQDGLQSLDTALQHLTALRKLDISCNKEIGGGFKDATAHLASLKNLQVLDLHQCCVTEEDMAALSQVIPLLSSLQELNLSWNKNIGVSSDPLLGRLRFLPKLKSVAISNCGLGEDSFSSLAEAALHLPELEILDLSWNKCVGGNLKLLLGALKLATEIRVLRLSSCNLVAEDLALLTLLSRDSHLTRLRKLDLSYNNNVSDEGWMFFCQGLALFKELSELDVSLRPSSCRACGTWFSELLAALTKLPALAEVGMQRWVLSESQHKQLEGFNQDNKRNVRFDC